MSTETQYLQLQKDFQPYLAVLGAAADTILDQDVSRYPIFVIHQADELEIGIPLLQAQPPQLHWSVQASTLEELATKRLIEMGKVDHFREVYKNAQEFLCLFVLTPTDANFVFLPR